MDDHRVMEITLLSAKDLNKVNLMTKMDVYAEVTVTGGERTPNQKTKSSVDHDGDMNPTWNFPMKFTVDEAELKMNRLRLDFKLVCQRVLGDKEVGQVHVSMKELSETKGNSDGKVFVSYQVRKPDGKPKGQISFSYKFSDKPAGAWAAATAPPYPPAIQETDFPGKADNQPFVAYPPGPSSIYQQPVTYPPLDPYGKPGGTGVYPPPGTYPPTDPHGKPGDAGVYPPPGTYPPLNPYGKPGDAGVYPPPGIYPPPNPHGKPGDSGVYPPPGTYPNPDPYGKPGSTGAYPPVSGYPPPPTGVYNPPSNGYPSTAYGYPQPQQYLPQPGFGLPPAQKRNNLGLGLGAGLLGGLLLGDLFTGGFGS